MRIDPSDTRSRALRETQTDAMTRGYLKAIQMVPAGQ